MSDAILGLLSQPLWVFMAVLARVSPGLMLMPPLRSASVPRRVRALFAIAVSAILTPMAFGSARAMPDDLVHIGLAIAGEVLLGMLMGSIIILAVTSLQIAGQAIGHLAGFDIAASVDPGTDEQMPIVANLLGLVAMALLLILGGHRQLLQCCLESLQRYPAGAVIFESDWLIEYEQVLRHTFVVGIRAAAPLATALLLANVVTGLLARTLPQLNVLAIGFNINAMALLVLLFLAMGGVTWVFQQELAIWIDSCHRLVAHGS